MTGAEPARAMAIPVSGDGANMQNLRFDYAQPRVPVGPLLVPESLQV